MRHYYQLTEIKSIKENTKDNLYANKLDNQINKQILKKTQISKTSSRKNRKYE